MDQDTQERSRLISLRAVLVLTFIGSGANLLSHLFTGLFLTQVRELYSSGVMPVPSEVQAALEALLSRPRLYFLSNALLYAISVIGAALMWRPRKNGFHYYAMAQLMLVAVALIFVGRTGVMVGDVMLTALFIGFYYLALRALGAFQRPSEEPPVPPADGDNLSE